MSITESKLCEEKNTTERVAEDDKGYIESLEIKPRDFRLGWDCTVESDGIHCSYTGLNGLSREECFIPKDVFVEAIRQFTDLKVSVHNNT